MSDFRTWLSYWNFSGKIKRQSRFIWDVEEEEFLDAVAESAASRLVTLPNKHLLWRAQLGCDMVEREAQGVFHDQEWPYDEHRMKPIPGSANDGRINPRGIPCLYLATKIETAIGEVRPWIGSYVSVAQFKVMKELKIVEFGRLRDKNFIHFEEPNLEGRINTIWSHMDKAFSVPSTRDDNSADYAPTQIIAERLKKEGYDGIAYSSSFGDNGYNVALFNLDSAEFVGSLLHRVDQISLETSEQEGRRKATKSVGDPNPST